MDFITVLGFLLVMTIIVYQWLVGNTKKDAARKQRPPLRKMSRPTGAGPVVEAEEEQHALFMEKTEEVPVQKARGKTERKEVKETNLSVKEESRLSSDLDLKNVSEARRAFIYSEIFHRKYD